MDFLGKRSASDETTGSFWAGVFKGGWQGLLLGAAVGAILFPVAVAFASSSLPFAGAFASAFPLFKAFSFTGLALYSAFQGTFFAISGAISGGAKEVEAAKQSKYVHTLECKINSLDARQAQDDVLRVKSQALFESMEHEHARPAASKHIQSILERGPRQQGTLAESVAHAAPEGTAVTLH